MMTCSTAKKIVLGIDASRSSVLCKTGVEVYSDEIILAILKEFGGLGRGRGTDVKVKLYTPKAIGIFPRELQKIMWFPRFWTLIRLSIEMLLHKPDILFVPSHVMPFFAPKRSFTVVHDTAFEKIPERYSRFKRWYLKWSTARALKICEKIIVPSESVKKDLIAIYSAKREQIAVIPHGLCKLAVVNKKVIQKTLDFYGVKSGGGKDNMPLFFYLGRIEKKKNVLMLVDAFKRVLESVPNAQLVLGGGQGNATRELLDKVKNYGLIGKISYLGYLTNEEISVFFRSATAFVFPSVEEGFGLPILQAFSVCCPVICSDIPVFKEVGGDGVLYVDPNSTAGFAKAIIGVNSDKKLRDLLVEKGKNRLKKFSWEDAGRVVVTCFGL